MGRTKDTLDIGYMEKSYVYVQEDCLV
jgi:hypothetical protein